MPNSKEEHVHGGRADLRQHTCYPYRKQSCQSFGYTGGISIYNNMWDVVINRG